MADFQSYAIDLGNTSIKVGLFNNAKLVEVLSFSWIDFLEHDPLLNQLKLKKGIFSSVLSEKENQQLILKLPSILSINNCQLPFKLNYDTPKSLGDDRLCNVMYAFKFNAKQTSLLIDIGTCIKFDFLSKGESYEGGSISPGVRLRYQSLNDYTANLPLMDDYSPPKLIGKTTSESIHTGVVLGVQSEINKMIELYQSITDKLTIFVTGGDAKYFDFELKNNIFAVEFLTLIGLHEIFLFNE